MSQFGKLFIAISNYVLIGNISDSIAFHKVNSLVLVMFITYSIVNQVLYTTFLVFNSSSKFTKYLQYFLMVTLTEKLKTVIQ